MFSVLTNSGIVAAVAIMVATAYGVVADEPLGFVALVIAVALGAERARPWLQRLRLRFLN